MLSFQVEALNMLYFNNNNSSKVIKIDYYADALARVSTLSRYKYFYICHSQINTQSFKLLMAAAKESD
jgi:hypothetical protein